MLCAVCGSENPDMGGYCFSCGKPLGGASLVIDGSAAAVPAVLPPELNNSNAAPDQRQGDPEVERIRTQYPGLVGVGGWLAWFCIVITVISPAIVLVGTFSEPSVYSVIDVGLAAFSIFTGVSIWKVSSRALKLTKILLIIQLCLGALLVVAQILESSSATSSHSSSSDPTGMRMLAGSVIWFSYFKKSKRVKATFGRNL
jgi:hypothetical protein